MVDIWDTLMEVICCLQVKMTITTIADKNRVVHVQLCFYDAKQVLDLDNFCIGNFVFGIKNYSITFVKNRISFWRDILAAMFYKYD